MTKKSNKILTNNISRLSNASETILHSTLTLRLVRTQTTKVAVANSSFGPVLHGQLEEEVRAGVCSGRRSNRSLIVKTLNYESRV